MDYAAILTHIIKDNPLYPMAHAWETDSKHVLHLHLILQGSLIPRHKMAYYRNLYSVSLDVRKLRTMADVTRTEEYLKKQDLNDHEVQQIQWQRHVKISEYDDLWLPIINQG